jgi:heptaprenyl diphosphate synthase
MREVEGCLRRLAGDGAGAETREVCLRLIEAGGKRLRPVLVLLSAQAAGGAARDAVVPAAGVELLHAASLLHDDVIDESVLRRGQPTGNALWGNQVAALAGTFLTACALRALAGLGHEAARLVDVALHELWEGQMAELEGVFHLDRDEATYIASIARKTGALWRLSCELGAHAAEANARRCAALATYAQESGIAFQIVDDVLDIVADEAAIGKPRGADIRAGVVTLPVIHALAHHPRRAQLRALLGREPLSDAACDEALALVRAGPAVAYALAQAHARIARAVAALDMLPPGAAVDALAATARAVLARPELHTWSRYDEYETAV